MCARVDSSDSRSRAVCRHARKFCLLRPREIQRIATRRSRGDLVERRKELRRSAMSVTSGRVPERRSFTYLDTALLLVILVICRFILVVLLRDSIWLRREDFELWTSAPACAMPSQSMLNRIRTGVDLGRAAMSVSSTGVGNTICPFTRVLTAWAGAARAAAPGHGRAHKVGVTCY